MSTTPTISEALDGFVSSFLRDVNVAMPGRVESYDRATQSATIQPLIQRGFIDEEGVRAVRDVPPINRVPVAFPGGGAYSITWDLAKGDTVLLVFSQRSLDKWKSSGDKVDPLDDRTHDVSDAVAIPGLRSLNNPTAQVASGAMVVGAPAIKLGGIAAVDNVLKGTTYRTAEDLLIVGLAALATAIAADTIVAPATKAAGGTLGTAITTFQAGTSTYISTKVTTE